ncbi:hypothetical protein [Cypionkella sp. TWP1-2-1b2]|uniref:hypothetical protein n=1 Tax=Cypionkella sp. TWP1-2-1b2 TaxID=2804675 RepID=UPI003CF85F21
MAAARGEYADGAAGVVLHYPVFFTVNTPLKTNKGYILDRFGVVDAPSFENFSAA